MMIVHYSHIAQFVPALIIFIFIWNLFFVRIYCWNFSTRILQDGILQQPAK